MTTHTERGGPASAKKRALDDTDRRIIQTLREDPQATNRTIARAARVSEMTVSARIESLIQDRLIGITVQRDVRSLGYTCLSHVEVDVEDGKEDSVARSLANCKQVFAVTVLLGNPQIVALVFSRGENDLQRFLEAELSALEGIRSCNVSLALRTTKENVGIAAL